VPFSRWLVVPSQDEWIKAAYHDPRDPRPLAAGLPHDHPHDLRHRCISLPVAAGYRSR
jgi:hypothetical protein